MFSVTPFACWNVAQFRQPDYLNLKVHLASIFIKPIWFILLWMAWFWNVISDQIGFVFSRSAHVVMHLIIVLPQSFFFKGFFRHESDFVTEYEFQWDQICLIFRMSPILMQSILLITWPTIYVQHFNWNIWWKTNLQPTCFANQPLLLPCCKSIYP